MDPQISPDEQLPLIRKDLQIFKGPDESDGSPTYNLFDPVRTQYYKISWAEAIILQHIKPGMTYRELLIALDEHTTLRVTIDELSTFFIDASKQDLLEVQKPSEALMEQSARSKMNPVKAFLLYYLFFRIPLINPDAFLSRTLPKVRFLLSRTAVMIYFIICIWGLGVVAVNWDSFISTFTYFFNVSGLIAYGAAICGTKIVHEFAHAYTAKQYGLRVPTMGVAFLILFPVLYTDVTDAWKLASTKKRMLISAAGVITESTIAALASILWVFSSPGILQSVFFVLASANWISTLLINLNPALRFDGYYLLMDWLKVENLQARAFQIARFAFYRVFLGMKIPNIEPRISQDKQRFLIAYAIFTFLYRLVLYTAIALFVYYAFTKTVGILLFIVEVILFFIWPVVWEITAFQRVKHLATLNERSITSLGLVILLLLWAVVPLPHTLSFPATTFPVDSRIIYVPADAQIQRLNVKRDSVVKKGDILVVLTSVDLSKEFDSKKAQGELTRKKMEIIGQSDKLRSYYQEKQAELARAEAEADTLSQQINQLKIVAEVDGNVMDWDEDLRNGQFVGKNSMLGRIASATHINVMCFVPERDIHTLEVGQRVTFSPRGLGNSISGTVQRIAPVRAAVLEFPELASVNGGWLAVEEVRKGEYHMMDSYFPVLISLDELGSLKIGEEGRIKVRGPWTSYLVRLFDSVASVLWREGNA